VGNLAYHFRPHYRNLVVAYGDFHANRLMVQRFWYYFLRIYVWTGLHFYFRKIIVHGKETIPEGPVIFAANHQNALLDALLIVCHNSRITHFLARADIFKKTFIGWLLNTLNMVPIYRIRDGWQSLTENQKTFDYCDDIFMKSEAVVIFPEGNHSNDRRIRPLSRGFVKMAFESLKKHPGLKIHIVPVGLNYSSHQAIRGSASVYFGEAIAANDFFREPIPSESNRLREEVAGRLKKLTTHIEEGNYASILQKLESTHPDYLDPEDTNERVSKIENGISLPAVKEQPDKSWWLMSLFYYVALAINFIPLLIWRNLKRTIKDPVFIPTLRFGIGISLFPLYYFLTATMIFVLSGWVAVACWVVISFLSPLFLSK
jgi:1-acyl-sn-glycerol-3-phosphate acyltransferase